jgi:hypothetical protein
MPPRACWQFINIHTSDHGGSGTRRRILRAAWPVLTATSAAAAAASPSRPVLRVPRRTLDSDAVIDGCGARDVRLVVGWSGSQGGSAA